MADGVLPAAPVPVTVVRKVVGDKFINAAKREAALRTLQDRHHYERVVAERRLLPCHRSSSAPTVSRVSVLVARARVIPAACS